jgi:hypothetical protein
MGDMIMKRIIGVLLSVIFVCSFSLTSFASDGENQKLSKRTSEKAKFEDVVKNNEMVKKYLTNEEIEFYRNIVNIKEEKPNLSTEEIINIIYPQKTLALANSGLIPESINVWHITAAEQILIIQHPIEALKVNGCKNAADNWTGTFYPNWLDGQVGNAYRHAIWNAFMTKEIGYFMAQDFATAHENVGLSDAELQATVWYGFNGLQHRQMDYYNNYKGREAYSSGDGETTLHYKIMALINSNQLTVLW